jgi:hypothetical protein
MSDRVCLVEDISSAGRVRGDEDNHGWGESLAALAGRSTCGHLTPRIKEFFWANRTGGSVEITKGSSTYNDRSLRPNVAVARSWLP